MLTELNKWQDDIIGSSDPPYRDCCQVSTLSGMNDQPLNFRMRPMSIALRYFRPPRANSRVGQFLFLSASIVSSWRMWALTQRLALHLIYGTWLFAVYFFISSWNKWGDIFGSRFRCIQARFLVVWYSVGENLQNLATFRLDDIIHTVGQSLLCFKASFI